MSAAELPRYVVILAISSAIIAVVPEPVMVIGLLAVVCLLLSKSSIVQIICILLILGCSFVYGYAFGLLLRWGPSGIGGERPSPIVVGGIFLAAIIPVLAVISILKSLIMSFFQKRKSLARSSGDGSLEGQESSTSHPLEY